MINILTFRLFEENQEVSPEKAFADFASVVNKFRFSDVLKSWIRFEKKRTGRIYLHSNYLPSVSYLKKLRDDEDLWFYTCVSQGENYGTRTGTLEDLLRAVIWDCIRKTLPTGVNLKKAGAIVNEDGWMEKNLKIEMDDLIYQIRTEIYQESGNISDLSELLTPLMKKLKDVNAINISRSRVVGSVDISVNVDFIDRLLGIIFDDPSSGKYPGSYWIEIIPSEVSGIKKIASSRKFYYTVKVGVKRIDECYKRVDSIIGDMFGSFAQGDSFLSGFIKSLGDLPVISKDMVKEISGYCGKDIEKIAAIKNPETRKKIIKINDMERFDRIINLHSDGLI